MLINKCKQKLELEYPCKWQYKVIGQDAEAVQDAIREIVQDRECLVSHSSSSSKGKYHSFNVELVVHDEADRVKNYEAFRSHAAVKMVL